ncbi:MAG: isopentenyl-diphosphate Delta-isomerase [Lapillicoccus sp.]
MSAAPGRATPGDPSAEWVVLLDDDHRPCGSMLKSEVHGAETPLHLAFSVYVLNAAGQLLVTRRALGKRTWPGVWTNSCCGHPRPGEEVPAAARRGLRQELGLTPLTMSLALPDFSYRAVSAEGLVENELCPVFLAHVDTEPAVDPSEADEWRWVAWPVFHEATRLVPWAFSPWSVAQTALLDALDALDAPGGPGGPGAAEPG